MAAIAMVAAAAGLVVVVDAGLPAVVVEAVAEEVVEVLHLAARPNIDWSWRT